MLFLLGGICAPGSQEDTKYLNTGTFVSIAIAALAGAIIVGLVIGVAIGLLLQIVRRHVTIMQSRQKKEHPLGSNTPVRSLPPKYSSTPDSSDAALIIKSPVTIARDEFTSSHLSHFKAGDLSISAYPYDNSSIALRLFKDKTGTTLNRSISLPTLLTPPTTPPENSE